MYKKPITILGINPGARYLSFALFQGAELRDWGIKVVKGKWSEEKTEKIRRILLRLIEQHRPDVLAIKKLHPARSSPKLNQLVDEIKELSETKSVRVYEYSIKYLKAFLSPGKKINKRKLAEFMAEKYPALFPELMKEQSNTNNYYFRMFEAAALASVCFHQLDKN